MDFSKYKDRLNLYLASRLRDKKANFPPELSMDSPVESYSANRQRQVEQEIIKRHTGVQKDAALSV